MSQTGSALLSPTPPAIFGLGPLAPLGREVCAILGVPLAAQEERDFEDGEHKTRPLTPVRDRDVVVIAPLHGDAILSPNDHLVRLLFFLATLKDAGAMRVTALLPYLGHARKDRRTKPNDPVTTRYVAQLLESVGTDRVIALEAHNLAAFQNAFRCPVQHLTADGLFTDHFAALLGEAPVTVISPDSGGAKRAELFRLALEERLKRLVGAGLMEKHRSLGVVSGELFAGDVVGRQIIVIDDLISSGVTMARAAQACRQRGAKEIFLAASHGLFTANADEILSAAPIEQIVVTDSVPQAILPSTALREKLVILPLASLLAQAIRPGSQTGAEGSG